MKNELPLPRPDESRGEAEEKRDEYVGSAGHAQRVCPPTSAGPA